VVIARSVIVAPALYIAAPIGRFPKFGAVYLGLIEARALNQRVSEVAATQPRAREIEAAQVASTEADPRPVREAQVASFTSAPIAPS
jgi:hypothetical protein